MDLHNINHHNPFMSLTQDEKNTKLICSAECGEINNVTLLFQAGANLDFAKTTTGRTALISAVFYRHIDIVRFLIEAKANPDAKDKLGCTALILAAVNGHTDIALLLIERGANLDLADIIDGSNALLSASRYNHADIVRLLIEAGVTLDHIDIDGNTALSHAISRKHFDIAHLLFSVMTPKQVQEHIKQHSNLNILSVFNHFKQSVIAHRMEAFKILGPLALDVNDNNPFSFMPSDIMGVIASDYCALGNKDWHPFHAELDGININDAISQNGPLTFSSTAPNNNCNKRKAQGVQPKEERNYKKRKKQ